MSNKLLFKGLWNWVVDKSAHKTPALRIDSPITEVSQKSEHDLAIEARVNAAYDAQEQQVNMMALVPHYCDDPTACKNPNCWYFIADKIKKSVDVKRDNRKYKTINGMPYEVNSTLKKLKKDKKVLLSIIESEPESKFKGDPSPMGMLVDIQERIEKLERD